MSTKDKDPASEARALPPAVGEPPTPEMVADTAGPAADIAHATATADSAAVDHKDANNGGAGNHGAGINGVATGDAGAAGNHGDATHDAASDAPGNGAGALPLVEAEADTNEADAAAALSTQLPGELLAARRQEMRLSIEELSARVKLAPRQLAALEANDFGALPGMATTRGFIRSCAKALGLDPEPLLAMLVHEPNPALGPMVLRRPLPQQGFNGRRYAPSTSHRRGSRKMSGLAAVVLIFVGLLAFLAWRNDMLALPEIDLSAARDAITLPSLNLSFQADNDGGSIAPVDESAPAAADSTPDADGKGSAAGADAAVSTGAANRAANDAGKGAPNTAAATANAGAAVDPARALELKLREDAWVEILTQNGERKLVSRLMKAGSTERIDITEPVVLVVGNAAGVDVTLRGLPVNLKPGTRDNVAKLNLK